MSLAMRPRLEHPDSARPFEEQALQALGDGNEDQRRFSVSSPSRVVRIRV
jgi:hypothetical protein